MQLFIIGAFVGFWELLKPILFNILKGLVGGFALYFVIGFFVDQIVAYANLFMAPIIIFSGLWWSAIGADTVIYIVVTTLKIKITMKSASLAATMFKK